MDFMSSLEVGDRPDPAHFGHMSPFPSPMPFAPALPGSPTLPPSGAVTPSATRPPSPTLAPEPDTPPLDFHLPSSPISLTPDDSPSGSQHASYFHNNLDPFLRPSSTGTPPRLLQSEQRLHRSSDIENLFEANFCASLQPSTSRGASPAHASDAHVRDTGASPSSPLLMPDDVGYPVGVALSPSNGTVRAAPQRRPRMNADPCAQAALASHRSVPEVGDSEVLGNCGEPSHTRCSLRESGRGHESVPSVSSQRSNGRSLHSDSSKRNAMFSTDVSPLDDDFNSWITYLSSNQQAEARRPSVQPVTPKSLLVDTRIYARRGSNAGLSDSAVDSAAHRLSLSLPASSEEYIHGWRREIASNATSESPAESSSPDRPLPPQAPPPKRPLPLLPDPRQLSASVVVVSEERESERSTPSRLSMRRPSVSAPTMLREASSRSDQDTDSDSRSATLPRQDRAASRSRPKPKESHPFAHPFAAATAESSPPPLRVRAGSIHSLGSLSKTASITTQSPSAPSFSSISSKRTAVQVQINGVSSCSPTQYMGNNGAPSHYQQATWQFTPTSPETPTSKQASQASPRHLGTHLDTPRESTSKRRFASVTFRGADHHDHAERDLKKKEKMERRSSGYFDSKSDYGFGESRTKAFMRKIAAWAR